MSTTYGPMHERTDSEISRGIMSDFPGVSIYVCIGRYGGFGIRPDGGILRVTLGWIVFGFAGLDLEAFWGAIARKLEEDGLT